MSSPDVTEEERVCQKHECKNSNTYGKQYTLVFINLDDLLLNPVLKQLLSLHASSRLSGVPSSSASCTVRKLSAREMQELSSQ